MILGRTKMTSLRMLLSNRRILLSIVGSRSGRICLASKATFLSPTLRIQRDEGCVSTSWGQCGLEYCRACHVRLRSKLGLTERHSSLLRFGGNRTQKFRLDGILTSYSTTSGKSNLLWLFFKDSRNFEPITGDSSRISNCVKGVGLSGFPLPLGRIFAPVLGRRVSCQAMVRNRFPPNLASIPLMPSRSSHNPSFHSKYIKKLRKTTR